MVDEIKRKGILGKKEGASRRGTKRVRGIQIHVGGDRQTKDMKFHQRHLTENVFLQYQMKLTEKVKKIKTCPTILIVTILSLFRRSDIWSHLDHVLTT